MPFTICVSLEKDGARGVLGGVGGDGEWCSQVREVEDRFRQEQQFESVERGLTGGGPIPG